MDKASGNLPFKLQRAQGVVVAVVFFLFALFLGPNPAVVPGPTDEANLQSGAL